MCYYIFMVRLINFFFTEIQGTPAFLVGYNSPTHCFDSVSRAYSPPLLELKSMEKSHLSVLPKSAVLQSSVWQWGSVVTCVSVFCFSLFWVHVTTINRWVSIFLSSYILIIYFNIFLKNLNNFFLLYFIKKTNYYS